MFALRFSDADIARAMRDAPATYVPAGDSPSARPGFREDRLRVEIAGTFEAARAKLSRFEHYPRSFTIVHADGAPRVGAIFVTEARHLGFASLNPCKVHAVIDTPERYAFAFHTLEGHAERGEERFMVERAGDAIFYELHAVSHPAGLIANLGAPIARLYQRRFQRESIAQMMR